MDDLLKEVETANNELSKIHKAIGTERDTHAKEAQAQTLLIEALRPLETQMAELRNSSNAEVEHAVAKARDAQSRYQAELLAHADDVRVLALSREELQIAQSTITEITLAVEEAKAELVTARASWRSQEETLQGELGELRQKLADIAAQNTLLHEHLESVTQQASRIKTTSTNGNATSPAPALENGPSLSDLPGVISYLRREKDVAEARSEIARQQEARSRQQLDVVMRQLQDVNSDLAQTKVQMSEMRESSTSRDDIASKLQTLDLLRESNETLRRENLAYAQRIRQLESQISALQAELDPLRESIAVAEADRDAQSRINTLLEEDNARWKSRTQQILQKYERIDPAELAQLREQLEQAQAEVAAATQEAAAQQARANAITTDLNDANGRVGAHAV